MPGDFEELEVYRVAREFRKRIYKLAALLPAREQMCLGRQMRRAAVSLTSNIAEGEGRWQRPDTIRFQRMARGSLNELLDQINVCDDEEYAKPEHLNDLREHGYSVRRLIDGYIRYLKQQKQANKGTDSAI
jgi:four helix bundle protein